MEAKASAFAKAEADKPVTENPAPKESGSAGAAVNDTAGEEAEEEAPMQEDEVVETTSGAPDVEQLGRLHAVSVDPRKRLLWDVGTEEFNL